MRKFSLDKIKSHLYEADVLLFRSSKYFWSVGWWISKLTDSEYSHTALVTIQDGEPWLIEYREFAISRMLPISFYLEKNIQIDVYRMEREIQTPIIDDHGKESILTKRFDYSIAKCITNYAKSLVGKGYSYWIIWLILRNKIPFLRLFSNPNKETKGRVCSTLVSEAYFHCGFDLIPNLSNSYTSPGDLARSANLNYLFTITK